MDGMQVVAAARERQADLAIIVLTGHGSLDTAIEALHQGIFDYLLKTTEPGQVLERVKAGLAARQQAIRQRTLLDVVGSAIQELRGAPSEPDPEQQSGGRVLTVGALQLDTWRHIATLGVTPFRSPRRSFGCCSASQSTLAQCNRTLSSCAARRATTPARSRRAN